MFNEFQDCISNLQSLLEIINPTEINIYLCQAVINFVIPVACLPEFTCISYHK